MGTDKSQLMLGNQTLVERIAEQVQSIASSVTVIGSRSENVNFETVPDVYPNWGALGGLHAALANCTAEWALVTACDLPFVTSELFQRFADLREDFAAVASIQDDGFPQPLCALYRVSPCLDKAVELIESGERRPIKLLNSVKTRWVQFAELIDLNGAGSFFDNINTPDDYARARAESTSGPTADD